MPKKKVLSRRSGPPSVAAELVALERRRRQHRAPVLGVHLPVADVLEDRASDDVGARLGDDVDDAAGEAAVLRVVAVGLDLELLDGVGIGQDVAGIAQAPSC